MHKYFVLQAAQPQPSLLIKRKQIRLKFKIYSFQFMIFKIKRSMHLSKINRKMKKGDFEFFIFLSSTALW